MPRLLVRANFHARFLTKAYDLVFCPVAVNDSGSVDEQAAMVLGYPGGELAVLHTGSAAAVSQPAPPAVALSYT